MVIKIIGRNHAQGQVTYGQELNEDQLEYWQYIQAYLKTSNATGGAQDDLDRAMSKLPEKLVLSSYVDLIRTTFKLKIVPALDSIAPTSQNFVGIIGNLSDGLKRYEACFSRLNVISGTIDEPFKALVESQINGDSWACAIHEWIDGEIKSDRAGELSAVYAMTQRIGLANLFLNEFKLVLKEHLIMSIRERHEGEWSLSALSILHTETTEKTRSLLSLVQLAITEAQICALSEQGLATLRIEELFDIIVDFPASGSALEDLKHCLDSTHMRATLASSFSRQCQARLLHPGANTSDIITVYISTIKAFLILDPPGVLLDKVARPIRKYLRERSDTIRCIISSLLGEVDSELSLELSEQELPEEVNDEDDPDWLPDPIDAAPDYAKNRASDIIGSLISIYENKDIFARELQTLLADRLLAVTDYNIDQELRNLELLKVRFGDAMLSACDVMLKDMSNSRRIDAAIHENQTNEISPPGGQHDRVVHTTIVSRLYWPNLKSSSYAPHSVSEDSVVEPGLKLPPQLADQLAQYATQYSKLKAQRSLVFQKDLGHVRVELAFEDRSLDMLVTPAHAASIHLFHETNSLTLAELCTSLHLTEIEGRRNLSFWLKQGVLAVEADVYTVIEVASTTGMDTLPIIEEVELDIVEELDEMSTFWNFIVGMLTNVGALESERIHSMLGMFAPSYDKSLDQLKLFLQRKTREGEVEISGGLYKLPAS